MQYFITLLILLTTVLWVVTVKLYWRTFSAEMANDPEFKMAAEDWFLAILMHVPILGSIFVISAFLSDDDAEDENNQHLFL